MSRRTAAEFSPRLVRNLSSQAFLDSRIKSLLLILVCFGFFGFVLCCVRYSVVACFEFGFVVGCVVVLFSCLLLVLFVVLFLFCVWFVFVFVVFMRV